MAEEVIYDTTNIPPQDTLPTSPNVSPFGGGTIGYSFQSSSNGSGILDNVTIALSDEGNSFGATDVEMTMAYLYSNNNGVPGTAITQLGIVDNSTIPTGPYATYSFNTNVALAQDNRYWIVLSGSPGSRADYIIGSEPSPSTSGTSNQYTYDNGQASTDTAYTFVGKMTEAVVSDCFLAGTRISTRRGNIAVEVLRDDDVAVTASGAHRPIRWIGNRKIDFSRHPRRSEVFPVRISAHAFDKNQPLRDLYLSPGHPVLVGADEDGHGGHLVPIMCLINGTTIERVAFDEISYWHVELDQHDILLAEGLPAESYIDLGSRPWFEGADDVLYDPDLKLSGHPGRCRPVAIDGPVVEAECRRLDAVFAVRLALACDWPTCSNLQRELE